MELKTPAGGYASRQITIRQGNELVLKDILVGEVWFASGQSNMEMPLDGFWSCPVEEANGIIARAGSKSGRLRYLKVPKSPAYEPQAEVLGNWGDCTPDTAPRFSAVGYFFASMLNDVLNVPVGIIDCTWGGCRVESWMSRESLENYADIDLSREGIDAVRDFMRPLVMYNGMLHPLAGYTVKGFVWYQGEANVGAHEVYAERLARMVALWRERWGAGELPFYFVEIAPFEYGDGDQAAYLREAQFRAQELIPNSGMVCTNDLMEPYERHNIHPKNKREIGERLACWALNRTYGFSGIVCESPHFKTMELREGKAFLQFTSTEDGFNRSEGIEGFEICGDDRKFYPADVKIEYPSRVIVSSAQVPKPVGVRYGFRNFLPGNLANVRGLPLVPFRTDDFLP